MAANQEQIQASGRFSREAAAGYDRRIIEGSRIILVGCGALGQFVALLLALIGYPDVVYVDMDTFEESNITRSPFYRKNAGKARATAAGAMAMCTATGPIHYRHTNAMVQWLGDALFRADKPIVVLSAVDTMQARWWLAERTLLNSVPLIEGGFRGERWNLSVTLNTDPDGPCWLCDQQHMSAGRTFSCTTYARAVSEAGFVPATASTAALLAARMVEAATVLLHGESELAQCTLFGNSRTAAMQVMRRVRNPDCRLDHRLTSHDAIALKGDPISTVRDLLNKAGTIVPDPIVHLPASFVRTAPCLNCHGVVSVNKPEWALSGAPRCTPCGGEYALAADDVPEQHGSLSSATSEALFELPLATLGIGPELHLRVSGCDRQAVIRVGGTSEPLLKTADAAHS